MRSGARFRFFRRPAGPVGFSTPGATSWNPGADGGTDVTESFELPSTPLTRLYWLIAGSARGRTNANGMRVTLEKMKAVVESGR